MSFTARSHILDPCMHLSLKYSLRPPSSLASEKTQRMRADLSSLRAAYPAEVTAGKFCGEEQNIHTGVIRCHAHGLGRLRVCGQASCKAHWVRKRAVRTKCKLALPVVGPLAEKNGCAACVQGAQQTEPGNCS